MKRTARILTMWTTVIALTLSLAAPAAAHHQICQWINGERVCIPPEEGP